ncbi:chorismate mutase [Saccharicrinis sp. FJH54]|uniref:chorismate mutase n=1 Tax=Saccharicrinis sp. FJH54 TaxID=3344665 RepID=UPI0035D4F9EE
MKNPANCTSIQEVRSIIDEIDFAIIELLSKRQKCVEEIVRFKNNQEEIVAEDRQKILFAQRRWWAEQNNLSPDMIENIYKFLVEHNISKELNLFNKR